MRALKVARAREARSLELRAASDLARLWAGRGESVRAVEFLAPIYGWFTEGFDTPDRRNAHFAFLMEAAPQKLCHSISFRISASELAVKPCPMPNSTLNGSPL